jgi:hypothetical protein
MTWHANQVLIRYIQKKFGWVGLRKVSDNWVTGMFMFSLVPYSNHAVLFRTEYIRLLVHLTSTGRGSGRGRAQAEPSLRARARPQRFESLSRRKPGPSRGCEPKPSPHITTRGQNGKAVRVGFAVFGDRGPPKCQYPYIRI